MLLVMKNYLHPHYVNVVNKRIALFFWNFVNILSAKLWRVNIGRHCHFYGKTIFRTLPNSKIYINHDCTFNSSHRSNLIGIFSPCMISTIKQGAVINIGSNCGFSGTVIGCAQHIKIGNNVRCGANTMITDSDWHSEDPRTGNDKPVIIDDNVWLGYGVKVLKGVHIGENTLIGAGSVVTKDIPANVIAAGNPCKIIKEIKQ